MSAQCEFRGHGKCSCQDGVWQVCGRNVAGVWQECGRSVAGVATADVWQEWQRQTCGRSGNGRRVAGMLCLQCQALNSLHSRPVLVFPVFTADDHVFQQWKVPFALSP